MKSIKGQAYRPAVSPIEDLLPEIKRRIRDPESNKDDLSAVVNRWNQLKEHRRLKNKPEEYILFFCLNKEMKDASIRKFVTVLNKHFNTVKGMTPYQLYDYFRDIDSKSQLASSGVLDSYSKMIQFFNRVYGYEHFIPFPRPATTKQGRDVNLTIFNRSNFYAWLEAIKRKKLYEHALMFHLMWELALRPSEVILIRFEDIVNESGKYDPQDKSLVNKTCVVHRGKTNTRQLIKISEKLTKLIYLHEAMYLCSKDDGSAKVVKMLEETRVHSPFKLRGFFLMSISKTAAVYDRFAEISKLIKRDINPKDMRTSSLSHMANQGGYESAAKLAGHKSSNTTKKFYIKSGNDCEGEEEVK